MFPSRKSTRVSVPPRRYVDENYIQMLTDDIYPQEYYHAFEDDEISEDDMSETEKKETDPDYVYESDHEEEYGDDEDEII